MKSSILSRRLAASFGVGIVLALSASAASAATTTAPVTDTCTGGGQLCNNIATVNVTTTGTLTLVYQASAAGCSDARVHLFVDGTEKTVTTFLAPGETSASFDLGPVSAGAHAVGFQAEGEVGGCNAGTLLSWGGVATITTSDAAPSAPVPAPLLSPAWLALFASAIAGIALCATRGLRRGHARRRSP